MGPGRAEIGFSGALPYAPSYIVLHFKLYTTYSQCFNIEMGASNFRQEKTRAEAPGLIRQGNEERFYQVDITSSEPSSKWRIYSRYSKVG